MWEKENIKKTLASLPTTKVFKELVSSFLVFFKCLMVRKVFYCEQCKYTQFLVNIQFD